ncbi:MAG: lipopolysaccharide biosynthesis protein, partial [Candidatus Hodarchaeota archaeon]
MLAQFKNLAKHTVIYGIGRFAEQAAGFILIPIYTRYLDPEKYVQLALFMIFISLLNVFLNMGFSSAFFKYYFNTDDEGIRKCIVSTSFLFLLFFAILICSSLYLNSSFFSKLIFDSDVYQHYFVYIFAICFFTSLSLIPLALLRAQEKSVMFSVIGLFKFFLSVGFIIFFVVVKKYGVIGVLQGMCLTTFLMSFYFMYYMIRHLHLNLSSSVLKKL